MKYLKDVLKEFAEIRKCNGMSIESIRNKLFNEYGIQISKKAIYDWEAGRTEPKTQTFIALCNIYGIRDIHQLFFDDENKKELKEHKLIKNYHEYKEYQLAVDILLNL